MAAVHGTPTTQITESGGSGGGSGTVTSAGVALATALALLLSVSGSPITTSGDVTLDLVALPAHYAIMGPTSGADAKPTARALVASDLPADGYSGTYQPLDADLTAIAALSTTSYGRSLLTLANQAALQTAVGVSTMGLSGALTDGTGTLGVAHGGTGITSFGTGIATFLGTPSSANLAAAVTDETGSGLLVFATSPTLTTPLLGTPTSGVLTNCTGLPEAGLTLADNTTANASTSKHGFLLKLNNDATYYMDGTGAWSVPAGGGGGSGGWTDDGTVVRLTTATDQVGIGTASPTYASSALTVLKTLADPAAAQQIGIHCAITGAGSSTAGFGVGAADFWLLAGYGGGTNTQALYVYNESAGTGTAEFGPTCNMGIRCEAQKATAGVMIGYYADAQGSTARNYGAFLKAIASNSGSNIGCAGFALNSSGTANVGGFFGLMAATPTYATAALMCDNGSQAADIFVARDNGTPKFTIADGGNVAMVGIASTYKNVTTAGWGVPAIYGVGRSTAQTAAVASVAAYTVGAADGSFIVTCNANVTTSTAHSFSVQLDYTDETNTARTVTFNVQQLGGTLVTAITNVTGAGPYEGVPLHIRAKASTSITIKTTGTFTTVTYNVEGAIQQIA